MSVLTVYVQLLQLWILGQLKEWLVTMYAQLRPRCVSSFTSCCVWGQAYRTGTVLVL